MIGFKIGIVLNDKLLKTIMVYANNRSKAEDQAFKYADEDL